MAIPSFKKDPHTVSKQFFGKLVQRNPWLSQQTWNSQLGREGLEEWACRHVLLSQDKSSSGSGLMTEPAMTFREIIKVTKPQFLPSLE